MMKYQIIIADDHEIVRCGVKFILKEQENYQIVQEASSFSELIEHLSCNVYDLLILDLNLGDKNGMYALREINEIYPSLQILVLSIYPEDTHALQSIRAGASGYLNKTVVSKELINAINTILSGKIYLSDNFKESLPYGLNLEKTNKDPLETLSKRELEIYTMIISGATYSDIAKKLTLSPKTISTYRSRILKKLELKNINQLIIYSLQYLTKNTEIL